MALRFFLRCGLNYFKSQPRNVEIFKSPDNSGLHKVKMFQLLQCLCNMVSDSKGGT
jgi:hypothetical protein